VAAEAALDPPAATGTQSPSASATTRGASSSKGQHQRHRWRAAPTAPAPTGDSAPIAPAAGSTTTAPSTTTTAPSTTTTAPSTTTPAQAPAGAAPEIDLTRTLPPGSALPSSAECAAAVQRSSWEPRPENAGPNAVTPPVDWVQQPFSGFRQEAQTQLVPRVKGDFTGTTDEILQWGACKWGFDVDTVRAQAVAESSWRMSENGDGGASWGILQIKASAHPGTWPWARDSTAYNVDYTLARRRGCYEGWSYEGTRSRDDVWGCIGMWFSGSYGSGYDAYVASVRHSYDTKPWRSW
jgi:autotransporter family porin